jgi:hypothetical protein
LVYVFGLRFWFTFLVYVFGLRFWFTFLVYVFGYFVSWFTFLVYVFGLRFWFTFLVYVFGLRFWFTSGGAEPPSPSLSVVPPLRIRATPRPKRMLSIRLGRPSAAPWVSWGVHVEHNHMEIADMTTNSVTEQPVPTEDDIRKQIAEAYIKQQRDVYIAKATEQVKRHGPGAAVGLAVGAALAFLLS